MALSEAYLKRSRFLSIRSEKPNVWMIEVFDPRRSDGKVPIQYFRARTMHDVRRVTRDFIGRYRIVPELIYHSIPELEKFFKSKIKSLPKTEPAIEVAIEHDIEEYKEDEDANPVDEITPNIHGARKAVLVIDNSDS